MWLDRVLSPGPLSHESDPILTAPRGPATRYGKSRQWHRGQNGSNVFYTSKPLISFLNTELQVFLYADIRFLMLKQKPGNTSRHLPYFGS